MKKILALDAMGGDYAPLSVVEGAARAAREDTNVHFSFFGDESLITGIVNRFPSLEGRFSIVHTSEHVLSEDKVSTAIRKKDTSLRRAIEAVAEGRAHAVVSSGNTGAYMALCKIILRTIRGIARPAISTLIPAETGRCVMLDMGANVQCDAADLAQFALMGNVYAKELLHKKHPTVGIVNMGIEEMKGHGYVQEAASLLKEAGDKINFHGFIEGDDINKGTVDVVVTDGFTGNACIKTAEGLSRMMLRQIKKNMAHSMKAKLAFLMAFPALNHLKKVLDPAAYNGALFIGINGLAIKSHGSSEAPGFHNAIRVGLDMVQHTFNEKIAADIEALKPVWGQRVFGDV